MNFRQPDRQMLLGLAPIAVAGAIVLPAAAIFGGAPAATIAGWGVCLTLMIFAAAESIAKLSRIEGPVERMLLTMGVRGLMAAVAVVAGVTASGAEPKTVALVALPFYLSLVAGEAIVATTLSRPAQPAGERN